MPKIIDIAIVIDTDQVIVDHGGNPPGTWETLKNYGNGYVFMLAPWEQVPQGNDYTQEEGGYELKVNGNIGDTLRFRMLSLAGSSGHQCFIESFSVTSNAQCITEPQPMRYATISAILDASNFSNTEAIPFSDHTWESTLVRAGTVTYKANFEIYDKTATRVGGYNFDPWIIVNA